MKPRNSCIWRILLFSLKGDSYGHLTFFFLSFQPLNMDQYEVIRDISNELRTYTPDVRILTTYYAGQYTSILVSHMKKI